jgi:CotH kinase protein/Lamin Tail Domain/Chitobiase/beta-hexosaminidase C-terminal domain
MKKISTLLLLISALSLNAHGQVVINEFSASNLSQYLDNHSDYNDWIELYNAGTSVVNLGGYYLSDDSLDNTKWQMPATITIQPNGFLRFWASSRNEVVGIYYHTNFSIKQTKNDNEWVVLSDPSGTRIDMIEITQRTQLGHSYGRTQNGASAWGIFTTPTINASNNTQIAKADYADKPDFDIAAGFYTSSVTVTITTTEPNSSIRYTTDGSLPTIASPLYSSPVTIPATAVLKAITYSTDPTILSSFIRYSTYFINVSHTLPVVSIAATQLTSLANGTGTLHPYGSIEYFDSTLQRTSHTYGEFNRHGQDSWVLSQRSLDFVSRDEMGYNHSLEQTVFHTSPLDKYQRLILRAAGDDNYPADHNSSNAGSAHLRDAFVENVALKGGLNVDVRRGAKCVVYLNGAYWGVYDLRDNPDHHDNIEYYYGQDKFHIYMLKRWGSRWTEYGGTVANNEWNTLYAYILNGANSMADPGKYQYVTDRLDVTSLVDYVAVNMFSVCSDWLNYNTCWWRGIDSTQSHLKWGYQLWDNDATYGHYINYTGVPNTDFDAAPCDPQSISSNGDPDDHIGIIMKLRQNPAFNQYYITRMIDLWNTVYSCDNLLPQFDSTVAVIDPEMAQHSTRWAGTYTEWQTNVQTLRAYIVNRCAALQQGFMTCYNLTGPHNLTVTADPIGAGNVKLNSLLLTVLPWSGTYFGNIQTLLEAQPIGNNSFTNWSSNSQVFNPNATTASANISLNGSDSIVAHFVITSVNDHDLSNASLSASPTIFNNETMIEFVLTKASAVSLQLYSSTGKFIADVMTPAANQSQGNYSVNLNLSKSNLVSGMYFVKLVAGKESKTVKIIYNK